MENTFLKLAQAENSRKLDFLTQSIQTLDIQLKLVFKSDSACRETPKSVEFAFINYEGVLKQSSSFPVRTLSLPPPEGGDLITTEQEGECMLPVSVEVSGSPCPASPHSVAANLMHSVIQDGRADLMGVEGEGLNVLRRCPGRALSGPTWTRRVRSRG